MPKEPVKKRIKRTMRRLKDALDKENYLNAIYEVALLNLEIQELYGEQRGKPGKPKHDGSWQASQ